MPTETSLIDTGNETPSQSTPDVNQGSDKAEIELDEFPEGGRAAWCAVVGGMLVQFCGFGYVGSFGVYQAFYTLQYLTNESASAISWIGSVNTFLLCAVSPVAGLLHDRGYFYYLLIGGSLLQSFSLFMLSLAQPGHYYQILLSQGIGLGIAQGLVFVPTSAVLSHYFRRRRTLAMTLVASGVSLGSIVHPIVLNYLFNRSVGFANGVRVSAALNSAILLCACLLIRTRLESPKRSANYLSVGRGIIHDVPFCIMSVGFLVFQSAFYFPIFYLQLDSIQHGNSETFSFYTLVILNGANFFGRMSAGLIAPRVGVPKLMITSAVACSGLILGMIGLRGVLSVVMIGTLYGYFGGIYLALTLPLMALLTKDVSELGARMGVGMLVTSFGNLVGGPISGALLTSRYEWWKPSLFDGLTALGGCLLFTTMEFARRRTCKTEERGATA